MSPRTQTPWKAAKMEGAAYYEGKSRDGWIIVGPQTVPDYEETFYEEEDAHILAASRDMYEALKELYAVVKGECPSLLDEDSGGDSRLALEIESVLAKAEGKS